MVGEHIYAKIPNRGRYDKDAIDSPILHNEKVIGKITDVDDDYAYGELWFDVFIEFRADETGVMLEDTVLCDRVDEVNVDMVEIDISQEDSE